MDSTERARIGLRCDGCHRQDGITSEWDLHFSFELGQILCTRCFLLVASWLEAELTPREAARLRTGSAPCSG